MALLDLDTLKASKNQKDDVVTAINALRESEPYLFEETKDQTPAKLFSSGGEHKEDGAGAEGENAQMNALIRGEAKGD